MARTLKQIHGRNIRGFREDKGESQLDMANALNVTQATVSRWEAGLVSPRDEQKVAIAEYLGVPAFAVFPLGQVRA